MDIQQLAYPDDFFDLVFGKTVKDDAGLEIGACELARVMKQGGRAAFYGTARQPSRAARAPGIRLGGGWGMLDRGGEE